MTQAVLNNHGPNAPAAPVPGMKLSKKIIGIWIATLFAAALGFKLYEAWMLGSSEFAPGAFVTFIDTIILFSITGGIPMAWWAFKRFRPGKGVGPLIAWSALLVFMGFGGIVALNFMF